MKETVIYQVNEADLMAMFRRLTAENQLLKEEKEKAEAQEIYLSPDEVSQMLGLNKVTLWRWEKSGYLVGVKVGGKKRYRKSDIEKLMEGGRK